MAQWPRASKSTLMFSLPLCLSTSLLGLQAGAAINTDHLGVHVAVGQQLDGERCELLGGGQARREQHVALELLLELVALNAFAVDGRVDESGGDRIHPDPDGSEIAGHGQ